MLTSICQLTQLDEHIVQVEAENKALADHVEELQQEFALIQKENKELTAEINQVRTHTPAVVSLTPFSLTFPSPLISQLKFT